MSHCSAPDRANETADLVRRSLRQPGGGISDGLGEEPGAEHATRIDASLDFGKPLSRVFEDA